VQGAQDPLMRMWDPILSRKLFELDSWN